MGAGGFALDLAMAGASYLSSSNATYTVAFALGRPGANGAGSESEANAATPGGGPVAALAPSPPRLPLR